MDTLKYIKKKYGLRYHVPMPISLPFDRNRGLTGLLNELNLKVGAEIGTSKGRFAKWLFAKIRGLKLYCVDPWAVYDNYIELHDKSKQDLFDGYFEETKQRLAGHNVEFVRKFSMDAVKDFKDNSLDFVFIDGNHTFEYVINDIAEWSKKVRPGGIISGHDYWTSAERRHLYVDNLNPIEKIKLCQVEDAVQAWTKSNHIKPWFITTPNGTDKFPSFLWIKQ
jgi:hypothetical protein